VGQKTFAKLGGPSGIKKRENTPNVRKEKSLKDGGEHARRKPLSRPGRSHYHILDGGGNQPEPKRERRPRLGGQGTPRGEATGKQCSDPMKKR